MLVFVNDQIFFRCTNAVCSEVVISETGKNEDSELKYPDTKRRLIGRTQTSLSMLYFRAVETYTARNLTYSSDIINALAGVLHAQGNAMNCDMFYGLPSAIFDMALLWQPSGKMVRREGFPSWSWAGWEGQVRWYSDTMELTSYGLYESSEDLEYKKITTWLRNQTWIDWYSCNDGKLFPLWSSKNQAPEALTDKSKSNVPQNKAVGYSTSDSSPSNLYGRTREIKALLSPKSPLNSRQLFPPTFSNPQYLYFSTFSVKYRIRPTTTYLRYGSIDPPVSYSLLYALNSNIPISKCPYYPFNNLLQTVEFHPSHNLPPSQQPLPSLRLHSAPVHFSILLPLQISTTPHCLRRRLV